MGFWLSTNVHTIFCKFPDRFLQFCTFCLQMWFSQKSLSTKFSVLSTIFSAFVCKFFCKFKGGANYLDLYGIRYFFARRALVWDPLKIRVPPAPRDFVIFVLARKRALHDSWCCLHRIRNKSCEMNRGEVQVKC